MYELYNKKYDTVLAEGALNYCFNRITKLFGTITIAYLIEYGVVIRPVRKEV